MPTPLDVAQASAEYWVYAVRFNNALVLVGFTTLYYDYLLTLSDEIEHFWKSANLSIMSVLFVVNRYFGLLGPIAVVIEYFGDISEMAIVAVMLMIRTYALYDRSRRILVILIVTHLAGAIMCLVAIVTNIGPVNTLTPLPFRFTGCDLSLTNNQAIHLALAWGAMLWFDTTIFILTLVQALRMRHMFPGRLLEIMFRDGTVYYGFMVAANVSNISTFLITRSGSPLKGLDTTLTNVLSTTLASRIILNLRNPALQRLGRDTETNLTSVWNTYTTTAGPAITVSTYDCTLAEDGTLPTDTQITEVPRLSEA
ncbi:uncharacterized protein TRAVEDRAFT_70524 [Trametes versicolor FP-101664 SS1]|uniref:uncharacterized protein n=1 Tax=Trametes versicolor (strain FP-101664) TaxID=717944 RepID=UPI0004623A49|nr:uncharacterized protein TRAVEDRAFT_70524 [Trametes versicolor FP-101664 SS1]EIW60023.1 hypothetical protein TRAVEDRAFT_70524 [Trametes versicolor FP-101664 SS1]